MENEKKFFVFYDSNAEGHEPFGEYNLETKTVKEIVEEGTVLLAPELNFENPGEGITLEDAVKKVLMGNAVAIGTSEDPRDIILTEEDVFRIYDWVEERRERKISKPL